MAVRQPFALFVAILFAFSVPFWIAGFVWHGFLPKSIPIALPVSALMTFMPALSACAVLHRRGGWTAVGTLLTRTFDLRRIRSAIWLAASLVTMPAVLVASFLLMRLFGARMPDAHIAIATAPAMFAMFFVGAAGEELGWQGFAFEELETRYSVLGSALILGAIWAAWHVIPFFQTGHDWAWVAWQCIVTVFLRVITVWLYAYGGRSAFVAIVFHAMSNVSMFLFPNFGSHYDPATTTLVLAGVTVIMVAGSRPGMMKARKAQV